MLSKVHLLSNQTRKTLECNQLTLFVSMQCFLFKIFFGVLDAERLVDQVVHKLFHNNIDLKSYCGI